MTFSVVAAKFYYILANLLLGGILATTTGNQTGANGAAILLPDFGSTGVISKTVRVPVKQPIIGFVRGTGSTTIKYPAACIPNPLAGLARGSGSVVRLTYTVGNNPAGIGGDIGFVKSCGDAGGSGATLINDTCTSTGCVSYYTTGTAAWNGADYIKFTPRGNLTSSYTGRLIGEVEDIWGE